MSVWSAPVTAGSQPTITVTPSARADVGAVALEYSGLSSAPGAESVAQIVGAGGNTLKKSIVGSGATAPVSAGNELALGFYADSGYGDYVAAGTGFTARANISATSTMMEQLVEDRVLPADATPQATVHTGAKTPWTMATIVFKAAGAKIAPAHGAAAEVSSRLPQVGTVKTAPAPPAVPLSRRVRPHATAGQILEFVGRVNGKLVTFYCLVSRSGKSVPVRPADASGTSWLPATVPQSRAGSGSR